MEFNQFVWSLYLDSEYGQKVLERCKNFQNAKMDGRYQLPFFGMPPNESILEIPTESDDLFWDEICKTRREIKKLKIQDIDTATQAFFGMISGKGEELLHQITPITIGLHLEYPDFFVPYGFQKNYLYLEKIAEKFGIELPKLPAKKDLQGRMEIYGKINQAFYDFRILYQLESAEMCAFLYDFALRFLDKSDSDDLPAPSQAWLLTGSRFGSDDFESLENSDKTSRDRWQAHIDTRRGDIMVMYIASPYCRIHSIWRAITDGFIDPFFFFNTTAWITNPERTKSISIKEIKNHPVLGQNKYVLANLQGPSGKALKSQDYDAILEMLQAKGQDISALPRLPKISFVPLEKLKNERDVEIELVEPLLEKIGCKQKDWKRQLAVKMGRGERVYPDYVFDLRGKAREETVSMVLEVKYTLSRDRDVREAYAQMRSYATRLQAKIAVLAAREGIWIFESKDGNFQFEKREHWNWDELTEHSILNGVRKKIGRSK
jgi:hypothetical protein